MIDEKILKFRNEIESNLRKYIFDYYKEADLGLYVYADGSESDFNIYAAFSSKNLNFKNFYGGEWISEWTITKNQIKGKIRINAHYFEDGNL
mmetsp:Transcript_125405/g.187287  ORF Transcript_125405/g.187287 Transcript_125405/m.187287 type:complete len:92 (+) Transcript_125405:306-581(+)